MFFRFPGTGKKYTIKAANNTRPSVKDPTTGKDRNMNNTEYKAHRALSRDKCGPCWVYCPTHNEALLGDHLDEKADFRAVLLEQWLKTQADKGWDLKEEWRDEAADFYAPGDKEIEEDERRRCKSTGDK